MHLQQIIKPTLYVKRPDITYVKIWGSVNKFSGSGVSRRAVTGDGSGANR